MPVNAYGNLHQDAVVCAVKRKFIPERHDRCSSSQARGNAREILYAAAAPPVFHGVERAVGGAEKFFWRVAIFRESCHAGAHGERGMLGLGGKAFADPRIDA